MVCLLYDHAEIDNRSRSYENSTAGASCQAGKNGRLVSLRSRAHAGVGGLTFLDKLHAAIDANATLLCVGLDPELDKLPGHLAPTVEGVVAFNRSIVEATVDLVCAYKPNLAFYEAMGPDGLRALEATLKAIPARIPVIGDAKRGDVGNTARNYARALFDFYGFDAVTVNPYLGADALDPFLDYADRGVFVLCRTSNPGAAELQDLLVSESGITCPLYEYVAWRTRSWNRNGNCGLVVGATAPDELRRIRALAPDLPLLIPGIGSQGGDLDAAVAAHRPEAPVIISSSRSIIYASSHADFAMAARAAAERVRDAMGVLSRA
ncbi:MAG TPA: orotidine-5'-phosphate decarboxylase [Chloroflexota bacterium]|nr:orotidine-5'-phosphate decarboxylase [Chloroflexota bacterium]